MPWSCSRANSTLPLLVSFTRKLAELTREGVRHIAINLAELEFMDSTGLSAIIAAHKRAMAHGGELLIFSPSKDIRRLFEVTGIDTYLNIRPSTP